MAEFTKITLVLFVLLSIKNVVSEKSESSKEELVQSESKDGKLEIIKQIKKVNNDGSYTIGYEADDGSFKIESRDVLGNIKGTYGYIDDGGNVKRVSYSTSNSSEVIAKTDPPPTSSVVQRIPKTNRTQVYTSTRRPYYSSTQSTPITSTNNALLRLSKLRTSSTTTEKPNYSEVVSMESELSARTTAKPPHLVYATSTSPRILLQGKPLLRSTPAPQTQKSEGQILRPEVVSIQPTELPLFRRLALKHALLSETKPVTETPSEVRGNILRRQLPQDKNSDFDPQQHVFTLQQALGNDATDVYSSSDTTGTPRPLFTTTSRPRALLSSTTAAPILITRSTPRYTTNYQRQQTLQDLESNTQEYVQESTTADPSLSATTPTSGPVVQIPANRPTQDPLVAIRHPFQRGTILVPLSQIQRGRVVPIERDGRDEDESQYVTPSNDQVAPRPTPGSDPRPYYVRRVPVPPPQFRPIPVQVDENGFIREVQQQANVQTTPYPLPIPITPVSKYINNEVENDISDISPPVSTRDFQKLLQQLIVRQTRLERISELTDPRRHPEYFQQPRYRPIYRPTPVPYYARRVPETQQHGPVQFLDDEQLQERQRQYSQIPSHLAGLRRQQQERQDMYDQRQQQYSDEQSYVPTRRVARLLQPGHHARQEVNDEYLPPDVREMLLLRMLQLAINPALPLNEHEMAESTTAVPQYKKLQVKNVEILGEESDEDEKRSPRHKRYRESSEMDYYESRYA